MTFESAQALFRANRTVATATRYLEVLFREMRDDVADHSDSPKPYSAFHIRDLHEAAMDELLEFFRSLNPIYDAIVNGAEQPSLFQFRGLR